MASAFQDPSVEAKAALPFDAVTPTPVAAVDNSPAVVPAVTAANPTSTATSPEAAAAVFPHFAEGLTPKKVKTQPVVSDPAAMNMALAKASNLSKAEIPTAASTAGNLITASGEGGVTNLDQVAYELATARRESHMGNWMNEFGGTKYFEQHYGSKTAKGKELGNTGPHDGANFHGRGLVQITGRTNYTKWSNRLNREGAETDDGGKIDLVNHPEQAAQPDLAARIAVEGMRDGGFTKYKMSDFINDKGTDFLHARKVINGMNEASEIADQATTYQGILRQHSGTFADEIIKGQTKNLPSAHDGGHLTAPTLTASMLDPKRMTSGASKFDRADKLLTPGLGRFAPGMATGKVTNLKTHAVHE